MYLAVILLTLICNLRNYKQALEIAKRKGYFIPILPVFLNYLEHSNLFYHEQNVEKLVYIQEGECKIPIFFGNYSISLMVLYELWFVI